MASFSATLFLILSVFLDSIVPIICPSVIEDLNNLKPPPDFNATITNNCINNPSLRYCNATPFDLEEIFKSTIVASHLCNISHNLNCVESFPKINLHKKPHLAPLYLSFTFFWKYCPLTITYIDISNNSLKGNFPTDIFYCSQIRDLDLSHNNFVGDVPVKNLSSLPNLTFLNLSYNHFSESGNLDSELFKRFNSTSFIHSGIFPDHSKFSFKVFLILVVLPIFVLVMVFCLCVLCSSRLDILPGCFRRRYEFTPSMLKAATKGFSKKKLVEKTSSVDVYYGILRDGTEVRIEVYNESLSREDARRIFAEGCKILSQLRHKNLVRVLGWCDTRRLRATVSEWKDGENVETWLRNANPSWKRRMKVMVGILQGVRYLNEEWPQVECDLKTKSILLNDDGEPLISRFKVDDGNNNTKRIFKFGLFILEMVSNMRPMEEVESSEAGFVQWFRLHYPQNFEKLIDEKMKMKETVVDQAKEAIELGLLCTDLSGVREQPSWDQISYVLSKSSCKALAGSDHRRYHQVDGRRKAKFLQTDESDDEIRMDPHSSVDHRRFLVV
ncbi:uncharacterized protein [Coffea arabica]|uniref:Protein kinase domain-containing protein n=1 Tax=Coffea arabica TaxID=13443 RepID=A0A6P6W251_COFAR|nr:putative leucine-rich repeat receptor-like serine/threonine-protein kinase At2g24130 [Coffea arabica]